MANWGDWLEGLSVGWIILIGAFLFFFPEPFTTFWGAVLIAIGVIGFFVGWWADRQEEEETTNTMRGPGP